MMPPKVKLSDGEYYLPAKGLLEQLEEGMTGEAKVRSEVNGQYTNYFIDAFTPSSNGSVHGASPEPVNGQLSVKDRLILAQNSAVHACSLLTHLGITANQDDVVKTFEELQVAVYNASMKCAGLEYDPFL
jgi:hypothetical protein